MKHRPATGLDEHQKAFIKLMQQNCRRHRNHQVFRDFCEMSAIAISNAVDIRQKPEREKRYLSIVSTYEPEEVARFPVMLAHVVESLSAGFHDCLGQLFMALELGDHWKGQFFTPYSVSQLMAGITFVGSEEVLKTKGYITVNEPTAGAGAMVIAMAENMLNAGHNYQQVLHVTAQDIDETAVHMTYIQMSLLHIPGAVVHGNSLMLENRATWWTPAHILGGWSYRLLNHDRHPNDVADQVADSIEVHSEPVAPVVLPKPGQMDLFA